MEPIVRKRSKGVTLFIGIWNVDGSVMRRTTLFALFGAMIMLLSVGAPVAAADGDETEESDESDLELDEFAVAAWQTDDGSVTVSVSANETPVENASVTVDVTSENDTYAGAGDHTTDADGNVYLDEPNESVSINVTATYEDVEDTTSLGIEPVEDDGLAVSVAQHDDASATVSVTSNGTAADGANVSVAADGENATYAGSGDYTADENGTVGLPAPNETVSVAVTAAYENETASTTAELVAADDSETDAFGQEMSSFVHSLLESNETDGPIGPLVASYAVENNPGNAPAHAGPPEWLVNESIDKEPGPPDHAGPGGDDGNDSAGGPPAHAGPGGDDDDESNSGGPPDHAGPPSDDGDDEEDDAEDDADDADDEDDDTEE